MLSKPRKGVRGFTLVELMIVIAIVGILSSIAGPAFNRYVKKSRTPEAAHHLNKMWLGAVTYYSTDQVGPDGLPLPKQFPAPTAPAEGGPECGCQVGGKCPGGNAIFDSDPVWKALAFSIPDPHFYKPSAEIIVGGGGIPDEFNGMATGDLDCDGIVGRFARGGTVVGAEVQGDANFYATDELE